MTSRNLSILAVVAVLAMVAGLWLASRQTTTPSPQSTLLYPELKQQLDAVTAVRIVQPGGTPAVELKRGAEGWSVAERNDFPADDAKLRRLITDLADAKVLEEKTSNPENYPALGVEDISDSSAGGLQLEIDGPQQPVKLIVGKHASGASSHYVRRAGEPKSWLIDKSIDTSATADQWLRKSIIDVSADRVQSAEVKIGNAKPYTALKKTRADADFTVEGLPRGKELSSPSAAYSFASALASLTLSDVQPASAMTDKPSAQTTIKTFDGLVAKVTGWEKDDKHYIALQTSYDPALAEKFKVATAQAEQKKGADETQDATKADGEGSPPAADEPVDAPATRNVEEEATQANAQLSGWVYEIPAYKYESIFKPVDELIKK